MQTGKAGCFWMRQERLFMENDLISVIVPVYNMENYLERCVHSVLQQTYQKLEVILVDDGSTDASPQMCDAYAAKDERVKVVHKENGGLSDARNAGLAVAAGAYIGYVDSDDWIEHDMYERMYRACVVRDAQLCVCRYFSEYADRTLGAETERRYRLQGMRFFGFTLAAMRSMSSIIRYGVSCFAAAS